MAKLRAGFLGITHPHASGRLRVLMARDDVEVVAAADDHPVIDAFVDHFGLRRCSVDEMLADDDIDVVLVHSKSAEMVDLCLRALDRGKAVLVEKCGGRDLADLQRLVDGVERTGGVCQVGYNFRFSQAVDFTDRVLEDGLLGDVVQVRVHGGTSLGETATEHLNQPDDMGGALWIIGCHVVDLALHHFGMPTAINARTPKFDGLFDPAWREDAAVASLLYDDRIVSLDFNSWDAQPWIESWQVTIYGTQGVLEASLLPARCRLFLDAPRGGYAAGWTEWTQTSFPTEWAAQPTDYSPEIAEVANLELFEREIDAWLVAARREGPVLVPASQARDIARIVNACYRSSAHDGASVAIEAAAPEVVA